MAVEKQVNIKITETGLDELNKDLTSLDKNLNKVDSESKNADSSLKKVGDNGGAISTLDSLTGGLATRIRDAAEASKLFNTNLKATRGALIASGVGALVVVLGTVIAYWEEITQLTKTENFLLGRQIKQLEQVSSELSQQVEIIDSRIELAELEGKSTEQLQKQKLALLEQEQAINDTLIQKLELQLENEKALAREYTLWERIKVEALRIVDPAKAAGLEAVSQLETNEKTLELQQRINEAKQKQVGLEISIFKAQNPEAGGGQERNIGESVSSVSSQDVVSPRIQAELDANTAILAARSQLAQDVIRTNQLISESEKEEAEKRLKIEQALASYKIDTAFNVLNALSGLAEEGSAFAKSIAVAQAVLSTYQGINKALAETTDFTPTQTLRFVNAAAVGVAGFANVAKILSTDASGRTKPNIGGGGGFGGAQQAPSFNVVGTSGVNQLAQTLGEQDEPLRAYVVSTEMSTRQALDRNIEQTATIS